MNFGDYKAIKCRLSHSGVRHENLSETYLKPMPAVREREKLGWSYDDLRLITNVYRTNN